MTHPHVLSCCREQMIHHKAIKYEPMEEGAHLAGLQVRLKKRLSCVQVGVESAVR